VSLTADPHPVTNDAELQAVVAVITLAFANDPMARWAFPDPETYLRVMPQVVRAFGGNGVAHGATHLTTGGRAAAMWLPPGVHPDGDAMMALTAEHVPADRQEDMGRVFAQMDSHHPSEPCWYLPTIGVDPSCQGRGLGSALLQYAIERIDRDGAVAYLESSNARNIPLYQRYGFEIMGEIQAGSSPTIVPMLRRAR
jgi:ribosomal protein S18 acetylase RimI-like enzyme